MPPPFRGPSGGIAEVVDRVRSGEQVLALIDPAARDRDPATFGVWLSARLTIGQLPRLLLPGCDARCAAYPHDPAAHVTLADVALDPTEARPSTWWEGWNATLDREHQGGRLWYAGSPANAATPEDRRLTTGTHLVRVAVTDPYWVHYDAVNQETLFRIEDGPIAGDSLICVTFGPSPLLPALAAVTIAPDHPPSRDPVVAVRLLAAGWAAVERGLPFEE